MGTNLAVAASLFSYGMRIKESELVAETESKTKQSRFPRSRKVRIRKKWRKDRRNFSTVLTTPVFVMDDTLIMHPETARKLREHLAG